jgi:phage terminase large subunit-like protein
MLMAANRCGKTRTGLVIDAYHLLGDYPDDWPGMRFDHAPLCWLLGYSGEKTRDLLQNPLFGRYANGSFEGGLIPADRILDHKSMTGTAGAMREVRVKHALGVAVCQFWSYSQGQHALMGDQVDHYHSDEEPEDPEIFPQVLTRTLTGGNIKPDGFAMGGSGILTFTPENGKTQLVCKFMGEAFESDEEAPEYELSGMYMQNATWDQCPHLDENAKRKILAQYPAYQRKMRSKGVPLLGSGLIFEIDEDDIKFNPSDYKDGYPDHWFVIGGSDFGWNHPASIVQLLWDRDADSFYLVNAWKGREKQPYQIWQSTKNWMANVPLAWPHDGYSHKQGSQGEAKELRALYEEAGFNMLDTHSTWEEGGFAVWPAITQIHDLMKDGRFKIANSLIEVFEEIRQYHTKVVGNNKEGAGKTDIVKVKDDLIDGIFKAYMMRRHAVRIMDLYPDQSYQHTQGPTGRDSNTGY